MIVRKSKFGLHIILHEAHGLLAGKIANEIQHDLRPINWFETLISICEHDDRQLNFDEKDYLSKLGVPLDFTEDSGTATEVLKRMQRVVLMAIRKSSWVRLIISYHLEFLYSDLKSHSKKIDSFLKNEEKERSLVLKNYGISETIGNQVYQFLIFCDRLSLILCKDETPTEGRSLEINKSIENERYMIKRGKEDKLIISPWIFEKDEFEVTVEERLLEQTTFKSSKEFEEKLMNTTPSIISWRIAKH